MEGSLQSWRFSDVGDNLQSWRDCPEDVRWEKAAFTVLLGLGLSGLTRPSNRNIVFGQTRTPMNLHEGLFSNESKWRTLFCNESSWRIFFFLMLGIVSALPVGSRRISGGSFRRGFKGSPSILTTSALQATVRKGNSIEDSFSTKHNLQRKLNPNVTQIYQPMTDQGVANSALLIGFHN